MITPNAQIHVLAPYGARLDTGCSRAFPAAASVGPQPTLRRAAIAADASAATMVSLSSLWRDLARGASCVLDGFFTEERCYLVLSLKTDPAATPIEARRLEILAAVLGGALQKNIAADFAIAPSTVALNSRLALTSLGVEGKPSRAHPLLMFAARAVSESAAVLAKCATFVDSDQRELRVISMPRPERCLATRLPSAELAVIRWLVEGLCYEEIARRRGTSTRTIANQICAVFRRLRVSGRNELVQRLFAGDAATSLQPSESLTKTLTPPPLAPKPALLEGARRSA